MVPGTVSIPQFMVLGTVDMVPGKKDFILKRDFENLFSIIIRAFVIDILGY